MCNIPEKYDKQFKDLLKQLEQETSQIYSLNITKHRVYGSTYNIGNPKDRIAKIIVYDIKLDYKEEFRDLEGEYKTEEELLLAIDTMLKASIYKNCDIKAELEYGYLVIHPHLRELGKLKTIYDEL